MRVALQDRSSFLLARENGGRRYLVAAVACPLRTGALLAEYLAPAELFAVHWPAAKAALESLTPGSP